MKQKTKKNWYALDNAAKIYPATSSSTRPGMFCLTMTLDHDIDEQLLSTAYNKVINNTPTYKTRLKKGVFWYFLEQNDKPLIVEKLQPNFLKFFNFKTNNDYLCKLSYYKNSVYFVVFHALGDGTSGLEVLKQIMSEYLSLKGFEIKNQGKIKSIYQPYSLEDSEDSFITNYDKKAKNPVKESRAFKIEGTPFDYDGAGFTTLTVDADKLNALAKSYNATITAYIAGVIAYEIFQAYIKNKKVKNKLVKIFIPVNLRKYYQTNTLRNFALFTRLGHDFENEISLEDCISSFSGQLKDNLTQEKLNQILHFTVQNEKNIALKIVPLFIKDIAMRIAYNLVGDGLHTASFSNLGKVELPESMGKHITDINFLLAPSSSCKLNVTIVSYNNKLNINFTRSMVENKIEKQLARRLTSMGLDVVVDSNYWEEQL